MKKKQIIFLLFLISYLIFLGISYFLKIESGTIIAKNLYNYSIFIIKMFPFVFLLIGLFEVWIKRETVEKHLGEDSGIRGFFWAIVLGGTTIGPMIVSLPIAKTLHKKGARLNVVITYLYAACICRIPMTIFEASYLGIKFTIIRYAVSIPLIILTSIIFAQYLKKTSYNTF